MILKLSRKYTCRIPITIVIQTYLCIYKSKNVFCLFVRMFHAETNQII